MKLELKPLDNVVELTDTITHVEKTIIQNQKALAMTLDDIQKNYSVTLNKLMQNNAQLTNQVMAFEVQIRGIQIRLAQLNNGSSITE